MSNATVMLDAIGQGDGKAAADFLELVYDELRHLAASKMSREAPGNTLQSTALVHEAWLRLIGSENRRFEDRTHFFAAAAEAMRRILIDRARSRNAQRRGGKHEHIELEDNLLVDVDDDERLLALDEALENLAAKHPVQANVVKLRYFGGLTNEEVSETIGLSLSTVKNYWVFSKAWLFNEMSDS